MKRIILMSALFVGSLSVASATGFGGNLNLGGSLSGWAGEGGSYSSSATVGGSNAVGEVNGTGFAAQVSANEGASWSGAGASVGQHGVDTYTYGGSTSAHTSVGVSFGNAIGSTAGGVGSDYAAEAWSSFETGGIGLDLEIGFGAGFGGFIQ